MAREALVNLLEAALALEGNGVPLIQQSAAGGLRNEPGLVLEVGNEWLAAFPDVCAAHLLRRWSC
jgi:hypothetical protein